MMCYSVSNKPGCVVKKVRHGLLQEVIYLLTINFIVVFTMTYCISIYCVLG